MDDTTNQPLTTPLGHERSSTPGQDKIFENRTGESVLPGMPAWTDDTSLEDIAKQYTGIGGKYNDLVENAADNVGDRQVQLVGNDFGATNPYMFNTYYEPAASSFASEMRMQGTQAAANEGLDRAEDEANKNLNAAKQRYNDALAAKKKKDEERKNAKAHVSETDQSKLPDGVTEEEMNNYIKATEGMSDKERKEYYRSLGIQEIQNESSPLKWDDAKKRKAASADTKKKFGITDAQWQKMSKEERQAFWDRKDVGNYWTEYYMRNYFAANSDAGKMMAKEFDRMNATADKIVDAIKKSDFSDLTNADTDLAGVKTEAPINVNNVEKMRKAIQESDKYSDEEKKKYDAVLTKLGNALAYRDEVLQEMKAKGVTKESVHYMPEYQKQDFKYKIAKAAAAEASAKKEAKEAFANMDLTDMQELLSSADVITAKYAGLGDGKAEDSSDKDKLNQITSVYGVSYGSWNAIQKMKTERPDDYAYLRDHASFIAAGGAAAFETVTDSKKKYFINGKWVSAEDEDSPIAVGDLIFHSIDGTINEDGEYNDKDLKNFVEGYRKIYTGQEAATDEKLKALQKSYNQYSKRLGAAFYLGRRYDLKVDENLYNVVLYLDGEGKASDLKVTNPANPNEKVSIDQALSWFMNFNGDQQNVAYAEIAKRARESAGYLLLSDVDTHELYQAKLQENGKDTIGQYGKTAESGANNEALKAIQNLTDEECLALNMLIDNGMKTGMIDKGFLAYDGVPIGDVILNSADKNFHGFVDFFKWAGTSVWAMVTTPFTEGGWEKNEAAQAAGELWDSMTEMNEADNHRSNVDEVRGNYYTQEVREKQADNLNHLIDTTFNIEYFNPENEYDAKSGVVKNSKGEEVKLTENSYFDNYGWKNFFNNAGEVAGAIGEFAAEAVLTAGIGKVAGIATNAIKGAAAGTKAGQALAKVSNAAKRLLTASATPTGIKMAVSDIKAGNIINKVAAKVGSTEAVKGVLDGTYKSLGNAIDDVVRKGASTVDNIVSGNTDDVVRAATETVIDTAKSSADNVVSGSVDNVAKEFADDVVSKAAGQADNVAEDVVEQAAQKAAGNTDNVVNQLTKKEISQLNKELQEAKNILQQNAATKYGLDAVASNADNAAESFAKRLSQKLNSFMDNTYVNKKLVGSIRDSITDELSRAAQRSAINTRLSSATGIAAERIAALPDSTADVLYGILRYSEQNSDNLIHAISLTNNSRNTVAAGRDVILGNIDFKKVAEKIVETSESLASKGGSLSLDDVFRVMATDLNSEPGKLLKALKTETFLKDRIKDWSRDIAQNYWTPELDHNFESHYVDFETYITSPEQLLMGLAFDVGSSALSKATSRMKLNFTNAKINSIMSKMGDGIDLSTANKADMAQFRKNMVKLDNLRTKAVKLNGQILDGKISFDRVHNVAQNAEDAIKKHIGTITDDLDMTKSINLIAQNRDEAMESAREALSKGTLRGRKEYKRILSDADQLNRLIIRGNDKLMAFQEVNNALQQASITRFLDIDTHAKTIHKLTGEQWGNCISRAWKEIKNIDYAREFGSADPESFNGFTINVRDKVKAKELYAQGQRVVYDKIYSKVREVMGDALSETDYRNLKAELNGVADRMIAAGEQMIDDGKKVRWNYLPTQALTWEAEPGTASASLALWGYDYKAGLHTSLSGEINNPELARDMFDYDGIIADFDNGQNTFKRRKGDRAIEVEEGRTGKTADLYKDVPYNWRGFDPAYAANAYLNSLDSARYVSPLLDPINGVVVKNPTLAKAVTAKITSINDARLRQISASYDDAVNNAIAAKKKGKASRTSKKSMARRSALLSDLSDPNSVKKALSSDTQKKVSATESRISKLDTNIKNEVHSSPLISNLEKMYRSASAMAPNDGPAFVIGKLNTAYNELGDDIKAVRDMYTKTGKVKKQYLDKSGNIKPQYLDVEGNLVPEGTMSGTFGREEATQYRRFVNQLANNKNLDSSIFTADNAHIIKFDDGTQINAMAFQETLYGVLATKQAIDLGTFESDPLAASRGLTGATKELTDEEKIAKVISKRAQPVELEADNARYVLTKEATSMLTDIYGVWEGASKDNMKKVIPSKTDDIIHTAINNAFDDVQAEGGQINSYEFVRKVDEHIPDFVKEAGAKGSKAVTDLEDSIAYLRSYENSGGTLQELLGDLRAARAAETDSVKIEALDSAIRTVSELDEFNGRTTNRAGLGAEDVSLDADIDTDVDVDADDSASTFGDTVTNESVSPEYSSTVEQRVDANLANENLESNDFLVFNSNASDKEFDAAIQGYIERGWVSNDAINTYNEWKQAKGARKDELRQILDEVISFDLREDDDIYDARVKAFNDKAREQMSRGVGVDRPFLYDGVKSKYVSIGGDDYVPIDYEIADNVGTLNKLGYDTEMSCSGMASDHVNGDHGSGFIIFMGDLDEAKEKKISAAAKKAGLSEEGRAGRSDGLNIRMPIGLDDADIQARWNTFFNELGADISSQPAQTADIKPTKEGFMTFSYGKNGAQPHITEATTFDAIKAGQRTSTTRLKSQSADKWTDLKKGDIVKFYKDKNKTESVLVRVTKAPEWINPAEMSDVELESLLQKEGWTQEAYDNIITKKVKAGDEALQFEFELVNKPTQAAVQPTAAGSATALKTSLDILKANPDSSYAQRANFRIERKNAFEKVETSFNSLANKLESKVAGKEVTTAYNILPANKVWTPEKVVDELTQREATISKSTQYKLERYSDAYDYAAAHKNSKKAKETLVKRYQALAEAVNADQTKFAQKARVESGTGVYRGNRILAGATDDQYLEFANNDWHEVKWDYNYGEDVTYTANGKVQGYNKVPDTAEFRNALIAGKDGFGNMTFMAPEKLDEFIKKNHIKMTDDLKAELAEYKNLYNANKDLILDPTHRRQVYDTTTNMGESLTEYLASKNSGNVYSITEQAVDKNPTLEFVSEGERYEYPSLYGVDKEALRAERNLNRPFGSATPDAQYGGLDSETLYDWTGGETVAMAKKETNEVYNAAGKKAQARYKKEVDPKLDAYDKRLKFEELVDDELEKAGYGRVYGGGKEGLYSQILERETGFNDEQEFLRDRKKNNRRDGEVSGSSLDDYEYDTQEGSLGHRPKDTPYVEYLNASAKTNVSEESLRLNNLFYGDGNKTGYFDASAKAHNKISQDMAALDDTFNENITDKITELKKLDGAKDGDVVTILEAAREQAIDIENKTVREHILKRIDEEIDFAKKNLELDDEVAARKKIRKEFLDHDPEYRALKESQAANAAAKPADKVSAQIPSGAKPVYVDGDMDVNGHITLQQIIDARKEVELSRKKNGKNSLKSTKETRDILKSMRSDFNDGYNGGSLISSGAANQQDRWILNLYARVFEDSGLGKLPKTPSFEDIENGFMTVVEDGVETKIDLPLKLDEVYVDPKIAALGAHYWGEGRATSVEKIYKVATSLSNFNKAIQDIQLAGGVGQFNAFTLRNAITMMWQDPIGGTRALFSNFRNARSNDSVINFYLTNHEKLLKMAIDSGDWSAINGFVNVVNMRDEVGGRGMIQEFGKQAAEIPNVFKEKGAWGGFWGNVNNLYSAVFESPTFVRWMVVAKADMNLRNYNHATRFVNRLVRKYGLTDDDFRTMEGGHGSKDKYIARIAQLRSDKYWKPSEFALKGNNVEKYLSKQNKLTLKQTTEALRGMPQKKTLRSCLGDFFFAIGYKLQMNAHPIDGIGSIFTALPNNIRASNAIRNRTSFTTMSSRFAGRGNRNEALVMVGIAALAHAWNTYIGAPSAWEELFSDHGKVENGTYGIAQSLLNFQDFGKFWLPNTQEGTFDPTQKGNAVDPFFSIFTLQNSGMRAANKLFFPNQNPYNWQRTIGTDPSSLAGRLQGVSDELIGANLLSGYKAIYEVFNNSTYFGNNIWERKYLPDGTENKNYNPLRNVIASVAHILNLEELFTGTTSNRWVKGLSHGGMFGQIGDEGVWQDKVGTVSGSGIIQHEYVTAWKKAADGEYFEALTESMELPFKSRNYAARARTQLNSEVMMALRNARQEYDRKIVGASPEEKDKAYAGFAKKAVDIVHDWSAKNEYVLGKNGELDATATKMLMAFMSGEYDDVLSKIQTRYDKLRQDLKMADGDQFLFSKEAMEAAIADGMDDTEAAEKHNAHLKGLQEAYIKEYEARKALIEAGYDPDQFDTADYIHDDLSAIGATFDKKTFTELVGKFKQPVGEFANFEEMKNYYEELIKNASTTKSKVKLAKQYNDYVTDIISPYVGNGFSAQAFNDVYWDGKNLSNELGKYIIIPADKYYAGKAPHANYLKDLLGIGWRDNKNLPSDKDIKEQLDKVNKALVKGQVSSAGSLIDAALVQLRKGTVHASPEDYNKLIRMRALLSSRRK